LSIEMSSPLEPRRSSHAKSDAPFRLHVLRGDAIARVVVIGDVREPQIKTLSRCLRALAERGVVQLVVDMGGVSFLSPWARRALAAAAGDLAAAGVVDLVVTGLRGPVRRQLAERHARTRIRRPRTRIGRCAAALQISLPRRP
jgi:anti-anti-sigma regulatory factor